jgi:hypothetical protein
VRFKRLIEPRREGTAAKTPAGFLLTIKHPKYLLLLLKNHKSAYFNYRILNIAVIIWAKSLLHGR